MEVTVRIVGEDTHEVDVPAEATYADLLAAVDVSPHRASVLVEGHHVPADGAVERDEVEVVRLVKGG